MNETTVIIDRRKTASGRSIENRQRVMVRSKEALRAAAKNAVARRSIKDKDAEEVTVKTGLLDEPIFHRTFDGGIRHIVLGGNRHYVVGDRIDKDSEQQNSGNGNGQGGSGEDEFQFLLSRGEYLALVFEGLELPNLVKKEVADTSVTSVERDGLTNTGSPNSLDVIRSLKRAKGRRIGLHRPEQEDIEALEAEYAAHPTASLQEQINAFKRRLRAIPWLDPVDLQYRRYDEKPVPIAKAVIFCMLDVSGSMSEDFKDYAKRFFLLTHLFISRQYEHVEIVFVRHTDVADEVDEKTFFYDRRSGGTVVSSGLKKILEIQQARFPKHEYNIYIASASDGDNFENDNEICEKIISTQLLPLVQFMIYIEVGARDEDGLYNFFGIKNNRSGLWKLYTELTKSNKNLIAARIRTIEDVYPVFREIFGVKEKSK